MLKMSLLLNDSGLVVGSAKGAYIEGELAHTRRKEAP
jgi:hypothetical protein